MLNDLMNNPLVWVSIVIVSFCGAIYFYRQYVGMVAAVKIVRTQFNPADTKVLDELVEEAKVDGNDIYVLGVLRTIRQKYGQDGVRVGHIMWILHLTELGCPDIATMEIPSFESKTVGKQI